MNEIKVGDTCVIVSDRLALPRGTPGKVVHMVWPEDGDSHAAYEVEHSGCMRSIVNSDEIQPLPETASGLAPLIRAAAEPAAPLTVAQALRNWSNLNHELILERIVDCDLTGFNAAIYELGNKVVLPSGAVAPTWHQEVRNLAKPGNKVPAIKLVREKTGFGLKQAKGFIDELMGDPVGWQHDECVLVLLKEFGVEPKGELKYLRGEVERLRAIDANYVMNMEHLREQVRRGDRVIDDKNGSLSRARRQIENLQRECEELRGMNDQKGQIIDGLRADLNIRSQVVADLQAQIEGLKTAHEADKRTFDSACASLQRRIDTQAETITKLTAQLAADQAKVTQVEGLLDGVMELANELTMAFLDYDPRYKAAKDYFASC